MLFICNALTRCIVSTNSVHTPMLLLAEDQPSKSQEEASELGGRLHIYHPLRGAAPLSGKDGISFPQRPGLILRSHKGSSAGAFKRITTSWHMEGAARWERAPRNGNWEWGASPVLTRCAHLGVLKLFLYGKQERKQGPRPRFRYQERTPLASSLQAAHFSGNQSPR